MRRTLASVFALAAAVAPITLGAAACSCSGPPHGVNGNGCSSSSGGGGAPTPAGQQGTPGVYPANPDGCDAGLRPPTTGLKVGATLYATVWDRCVQPPTVHLLTITLYQVKADGSLQEVTSQIYARIPPEVQTYNLLTWPCIPGTYVVRGDIEGTWSNGDDFSGVHVQGTPVVVNPSDCA